MRIRFAAAGLMASVLVVLAATMAVAETAREILDRRKQLDDTSRKWEDRHQHMRLRIAGRAGGERQKDLELYERKYPGDEQKSIVFFLAPAEVKGTAFLSHSHKGRPADQWLYLPEVGRTRQITTQLRKQSFVGTDLSYQDLDLITEMVSWTEADATSTLSGTEVVDGIRCHAIELAPKRADIGYTTIRLWLGVEDLVPRRLEFLDGNGAVAKRVLQSDVRAVGTIPTAHRIHVETPAAGTHTDIEIGDVRFNGQLEDALFTQRALERGTP